MGRRVRKMEKYREPEMEIIKFEMKDIIVKSGVTNQNTGKVIELPAIPIK